MPNEHPDPDYDERFYNDHNDPSEVLDNGRVRVGSVQYTASWIEDRLGKLMSDLTLSIPWGFRPSHYWAPVLSSIRIAYNYGLKDGQLLGRARSDPEVRQLVDTANKVGDYRKYTQESIDGTTYSLIPVEMLHELLRDARYAAGFAHLSKEEPSCSPEDTESPEGQSPTSTTSTDRSAT